MHFFSSNPNIETNPKEKLKSLKMINTYKESSLHSTLKKLYSMEEGSRTEVSADGHIYDILTKDENVIEIQTKNLGKLKEKLLDALTKGRKVKVVHPIPVRKTIETYDQKGNLISKRKSPKKESLYSLFNELKGIYPLITKENFSLEVILIEMIEIRTKTDKPEQSENKRRRFKRDWQKTDKKLVEIIETRTFDSYKDYLKLLPQNLPEKFSTAEIKEEFKKDDDIPANACSYANLIVWTLSKAGLIKQTGKKGNLKLYKIDTPETYGDFRPVK